MEIGETLQKSLSLANSSSITDTIFKNLVENCFATLTGQTEPHNFSNLYNSKPDVVKELYATLLSAGAQFVRNNLSKDSVAQILSKKCGYNPAKVDTFINSYHQNREDVEVCLINLGIQPPHVTDAQWKIDYIIKSSYLDSSGGLLFRIGLQTESYSSETQTKKVEFVSFTCDCGEMQDLIYKLKEALRHCHRIGNEH